MPLKAQIVVKLGTFELDVDLAVERGEVVALLGPNGSGKSTLLAAIAGLLPPVSGSVTVGDRTLSDFPGGKSSRRISVAPQHRGISLLGQDPLLFPHLSALENVAFGQRSQGEGRIAARRRAGEWLGAVGLSGFEDRRPAALSGGQQQRVAIARALAAEPAVLLLDEPMAALDVQTATLIRTLLRERIGAGQTTTVLVTHDVLDAIVLADRVAILQNGRIVDDGPKARVLGEPRNRFIAALAGVNLVSGTVVSDGVVATAHGRRFSGRMGDRRMPVGAAASVVFRPSAVRVTTGHRADETVNQWQATIDTLEPASGGIRFRTAQDPTVMVELSPFDVAEQGLESGSTVWLCVPKEEVLIYPAR